MSSLDPSELLSHTAWLRQLARSLVHEGADDLVQDTWITALRRPPRGERGLRPWLRTVITNAARLRWRGEKNRTAREQAVAGLDDQETPSTADLLERHELQQLLARLVGELDEPYRSTVLLRFAEGLKPTEIARRLGIPAGTVRWRLKEALGRLRAELDAAHKNDRRAWVLAFAPLAIPRASRAAPAIPIILISALAITAIVALVWPPSGGAPSATKPLPALSQRGSNSPNTFATSPEGDVTWLAQEGVPPRGLAGRVVMKGVPVAGATVRLLRDPLPPRDLETDRDGRFDFGEQIPREYVVGASLPGKLAAIHRIDLRDPSAPRDIQLVLEDCSASLYGRVVDAAGTPIESAHVTREGIVGAQTDRAGNYELCVLPTAALVAELRVVVRADGFGTVATTFASLGRMQHDFVLAPEATVLGRVVGPQDAPIANARVALDLTGPAASILPERGVSLTTVTDQDGRFRISGLAAGEYSISSTSADATSAAVRVNVDAAENVTVVLRTVETGVIRGRVVSSGTPIGGVTVAAAGERAISQPDGTFVLPRVPVGDVTLETTPYKLNSGPVRIVEGDRNPVELVVIPMGTFRGTVRRHGVPVPFARVDIAGPSKAGVTADESGRYEARGLEPGKYGFYSDDRRRRAMYAEDRVVELGPAETRQHDIELAWGGIIAGRVIDSRDNAVPGVVVSFHGGSDCLSDASGAFECGGLAGGTYAASVRPTRAAAHRFRFVKPPASLELRDGDARVDGVRLVVEPTLFPIAGTVRDRSSAPVPDVTVRAFAIGGRRSIFDRELAAVTDTDGNFQINGLSAGDYYLEVESKDRAVRETVSAGATSVSLVLDRSRCEAVRGHDPPSLTQPTTPIIWNQQIELLGWSLPSTTSPGKSIELTLVYRVTKPVDRDWRIFAHFDSQTTRVNADHEPAIGWCATSEWRVGDVIVDRVPVEFAQPGQYALTVGFFGGSASNWENLPLSAPIAIDKAGARLADIAVK